MLRNKTLMLQGVSMINPQTINVSPDSIVERDTILHPNVNISGSSCIGHSCKIEQGALLKNCQIGDNVTIGPYSCLFDCTIASNMNMPPFSKNF